MLLPAIGASDDDDRPTTFVDEFAPRDGNIWVKRTDDRQLQDYGTIAPVTKQTTTGVGRLSRTMRERFERSEHGADTEADAAEEDVVEGSEEDVGKAPRTSEGGGQMAHWRGMVLSPKPLV